MISFICKWTIVFHNHDADDPDRVRQIEAMDQAMGAFSRLFECQMKQYCKTFQNENETWMNNRYHRIDYWYFQTEVKDLKAVVALSKSYEGLAQFFETQTDAEIQVSYPDELPAISTDPCI